MAYAAQHSGYSGYATRGGSVSVESFNEHAPDCGINSPRSLAAMRRLGISGDELLFRPQNHRSFSEGVDRTALEVLPDAVSRRFQHYEQKRQAKLHAVREERAIAIEHAGQGQMVVYAGSGGAHHGADSQLIVAARDRAITALEMEKQEVARMQQRLLTKLNNTLAFEIRRAQTLDRAQAKVDYAHARAEAEKQYRAHQQSEREEAQKHSVEEQKRRIEWEAEERRRVADEAWRRTQDEKIARVEADKERRRMERAAQVDLRNRNEEKRMQLEAIQNMQRQMIAEKEERMRLKDEERMRAQEESRRALHEYHEAQSRAQREKFEATLAKNQEILEEKRQRYLEKEALAEQKRQEFEQMRDWERRQMRARAKQKEETIRAAQAAADAHIRAKAEVTLSKEQAHAERLAERDRMRQSEEHERKRWLQDREMHRRMILEQSYAMREERGNQILAKRAELNARSENVIRSRDADIHNRKLQEAMLQQDRKEQIRRMERIQQNQREELLARIRSDRERIESLQEQSQALAQQRMKLRDMAERQQTLLLQQFEKLKAHPEKLRNLDPNNVDVIKMGFVNPEDMGELLAFNDHGDYDGAQLYQPLSSTPSRGGGRGTPSRHSRSVSNSSAKKGGARARPASAPRRKQQGSIMDAELPRPHTTQNGRGENYGQPSQEYLQYAQGLQTH